MLGAFDGALDGRQTAESASLRMASPSLGKGEDLKIILVIILLSLHMMPMPLAAMGEEASSVFLAQERGGSERQLQSLGPVNDETTALKTALEYFKKKINPKGPQGLNLGKPNVFKDAMLKQWIISWPFPNGSGRIAIVVDAKTGESYQADTGTD
jgi:hypothetical protein